VSADEVDRLLDNLKADPDTIRRLRFFESESKLALRERLQNAMLASADRALKTHSERANVRFWDINRVANEFVLANASEAALAEVVDILRSEFAAAEAWDRLEGGK
jgi:hypothetical protein